MGRNLFRRIEVAFPVLDPELKARVIAEGLEPYLADNRDAWELAADGSYQRVKPARRARARFLRSTSCSRRLAENQGAQLTESTIRWI